MNRFKVCNYSAFISYAHADDEGWISDFASELERRLRNRVGRSTGVTVPGMHLSGKDGPVGGSLSSELQARIAESFVMIIVVHDDYAQSPWCLKELEYFKALFGERGFLDRLYVVAMSERAINLVCAKPSWKQLLPFDDQIWIPFFREDDHNRPARVRLDQGQFSQRFEDQLERLLVDLVDKVKADCALPPAPPPPPLSPSADGRAAATPASTCAAPLLFGVASPELAAPVRKLADELRAAGVQADLLAPESLNGDFPEFDSASHLVLPFSSGGESLRPYKFSAGGHLAAQRDVWMGKGRPASQLIWLDLREFPCAAPAGRGHAELVAQIEADSIKPDALRQRFLPQRPPLPPPAPVAASERVNIYIESNQNEVDLWDPLGEKIKKKWDELVLEYGTALVPPLCLHARGLPLAEIEKYPALDDADGVVMLWGQKSPDSLRNQIEKVELKMPGDMPPGIVAYLMPPQPDPKKRVLPNLWKVLRFQGADSADIDIVQEEAALLKEFLRKILVRSTRKRHAAVLPAAPTLP